MNTATMTATMTAPAPVSNMIQIDKAVGAFLQAAIDAKSNADRPRLNYVLATDMQLLITTDGYRMHVWPMGDQQYTPGYYLWDKKEMLIRVDNSAVGNVDKPMWQREQISYPKIMGESQHAKPLTIYGAGAGGCLTELELKTLPAVKVKPIKPRDKSPIPTMSFRRGIIDGETRAVCLGVSALSLVWQEDGTVEEAITPDLITLDAAFALAALSSPLVRPVLRWVDSQEGWFGKPAIIGDLERAHAVIMPIYKRSRED